MPHRPRIISAIGTPLREDGALHREALAIHLEDQWANAASGVLVAGTMGAMPMLPDRTYAELVAAAAELGRGRGELLVGIGDASLQRTLDRLRVVADASSDAIDGVVSLPPSFVKPSQTQVERFFTELADRSPYPVFAYSLPSLTGVAVSVATALRLAEHPNMAGIKSSMELDQSLRLWREAPAGFRVIVAKPMACDALGRLGVEEMLDGVFALAPSWIDRLCVAVEAGDDADAARWQGKLNALLDVLGASGEHLWAVFSMLLNERGVPGRFVAAPYDTLPSAIARRVRARPIVDELLATTAVTRSRAETVS